ncbi:MAG: response regulator [Armatimonadetes bacterium]|nr:response regulator [Armatimonadota bacterium]
MAMACDADPARGRRRVQLTRVLALLFCLSAIGPLLFVSAPLRKVLMGHERRQVLSDSTTLARAAAALARQQMLACEVVLDQLHNMVATHGADDARMADLLDRVVATTPSLESIYVVDSHDRIIAVGLSPQRAAAREDYLGLDLSAVPVLRAARESTVPAWSDAYRSLVTGALSATVAQRRGDYVVLAHLGLDRLRRSADTEVAGATHRCLALLDQHGNIIFSEQPDGATDRLLWARLMALTRAGKGSSEQVMVSGRAYLGSLASVDKTGWWLMVCQDAGEAFRPLRHLAVLFWTVLLLAATLAGLGGWLVGRRVARPLVHLHEAALALAGGDYTARLPESPYVEVAGLAGAFAVMSDAVREREADLRSLAETISESSGDQLYESIAIEVARQTGCEYVLVTELLPGGHCRSLTYLAAGRFGEPIEFELGATPCEQAVQHGLVVYERGVRALFPDDADLVALGAESYAGLCLRGADGEVIGTLAALSREPLVVSQLVREALSILATRAATELTRERAAREREALEGRLQQSSRMEAIGQLAGGVAHDFNNLLTSIRGYADMLAESPLDEQQREDLDQVVGAAQRAASLTRQLLTFSRRQMVQPRIADLGQVLVGLRAMLQPLVGEDVDFGIEVPETPVWVHADPTQIEQVVVNLVVNARAAMPRGGVLRIVLSAGEGPGGLSHDPDSAADGHALLAVTDTGVGMDEATRERIFEPFFTTKPAHEGTGLGLSTVYGIVRQASGQIACESAPGLGTTFRVWLPLAAAGAESPREPAAEEPSQGGRETVLVVEDADAIRRLARRMLERHGYRVLDAGLPSVALAMLSDLDQPIDLLFTDVVMPEMDGVELADRARAERPALPVVFTSGYTDQTRAEQAIARLGACLLPKPYTAKALLRVVREQVGGEAAGEEN